jgi:predicted DCC family thiol-disulfide oxidoreductase YuxK
MMPGTPILVYDGPCTLCNRTVQWVFDKDASERILFTSLQSNWAQANVPPALRTIDSVLFFDGTQWHVKSDAVLYLLRELPRPWRSFFELRIIPRALRNVGYDLLAKFRYRLFGTGHCALLPKERVLV